MEQPVYTTSHHNPAVAARLKPSADAPGRAATSAPAAAAVYLAAKRGLDILGAVFGLLLLAPVFLALALLVRRDSPGPIFHRRRVLARQNYGGGIPEGFDAFKFRTMVADADARLERDGALRQAFEKDYKLRDDPRVTRFGATLRTTSLDELPQLWNVLRGQMSLVGPRMISPPELAMYGENAAALLSVRPGITGLWQVSGRQHISYRERVQLDMWYIENRSLRLDLEILLRTVESVLRRKGAF